MWHETQTTADAVWLMTYVLAVEHPQDSTCSCIQTFAIKVFVWEGRPGDNATVYHFQKHQCAVYAHFYESFYPFFLTSSSSSFFRDKNIMTIMGDSLQGPTLPNHKAPYNKQYNIPPPPSPATLRSSRLLLLEEKDRKKRTGRRRRKRKMIRRLFSIQHVDTELRQMSP